MGADRRGPPRARRAAGEGCGRVRILLVGGGGREHALAWRISESPLVDVLLAAPGNPGIARHAPGVGTGPDPHDDLVPLARRERTDLTVAGPEAPLVPGLADRPRSAGLC